MSETRFVFVCILLYFFCFSCPTSRSLPTFSLSTPSPWPSPARCRSLSWARRPWRCSSGKTNREDVGRRVFRRGGERESEEGVVVTGGSAMCDIFFSFLFTIYANFGRQCYGANIWRLGCKMTSNIYGKNQTLWSPTPWEKFFRQ